MHFVFSLVNDRYIFKRILFFLNKTTWNNSSCRNCRISFLVDFAKQNRAKVCIFLSKLIRTCSFQYTQF